MRFYHLFIYNNYLGTLGTNSDETVVALATKAGVKWPDTLTGAVGDVSRVNPTTDSLTEALSVDLDAPGQRNAE
jgi:hypothetical protein